MKDKINFPIPYGRHAITQADKQAVMEVLDSDFLTQGAVVPLFEDRFASFCGAEYALAVNSGTSALHLAVLALGVQPAQKVLCSAMTFVAGANCIHYAGGSAEFADIDPQTGLLDLEKVRQKLEMEPPGSYAGIIVTDYAGLMPDLEAFRALADAFGIWLIEDACHAPGASFTDKLGECHTAGNGRWADVSVFSFHPVKHLTTAEGGMLTTNLGWIYHKMKALRSHGILKNESDACLEQGGWMYEMRDLGYNYRMSDLQAALGNAQLSRIGDNLRRRNLLAKRYLYAFAGVNLECLNIQHGFTHSWHLFVVKTKERRALYEFLREAGIHAQVHYIPVHLQPWYKGQGWEEGDLPSTEAFYSQCLSLPLFPELTDAEQEYIIEQVNQFYESNINSNPLVRNPEARQHTSVPDYQKQC